MSSKNTAKWLMVLERRRARAFSDRTVRWLGDGAKGRGDGHGCGEQELLLTGLVPPEEVPKYVGIMDALVHLSLREGLSRALPPIPVAAETPLRMPLTQSLVQRSPQRLSVAFAVSTSFMIAASSRDRFVIKPLGSPT